MVIFILIYYNEFMKLTKHQIAAQKLKDKFGKDYFANLGRIGGKKSRNGGFASLKVGRDGLTGYQRARIVGQKGGKISKRGVK